jgi:HSP20 family molecular chaperone IbpA
MDRCCVLSEQDGCVTVLPLVMEERGTEYIIRARMPGVRREEVRLHLRSHAISLEARCRPRGNGDDSLRSFALFPRRIPLPADVREDMVRYECRGPVVVVHMPRHKQPSQCEVN